MTERLLSAVPSCSYSSTAGDTISCEGRHGLESFCLPHGRASTGASISGDPASRYYFYGHEKDYDEDGSSYSSDSQQFLSSLLFQQENHPHAASFRRSFHARQLCDHPPYRQSSAPSATPSSVPSIEAQSNDDGVIRYKKTKHKKVVSHGTLTTVSTASNSFWNKLKFRQGNDGTIGNRQVGINPNCYCLTICTRCARISIENGMSIIPCFGRFGSRQIIANRFVNRFVIPKCKKLKLVFFKTKMDHLLATLVHLATLAR